MNFARALFAVSGFTMLSRLAGFGRDLLVAAVLGAGPVADAFFVAQRLPNLFRTLFAEGAFNASFVPHYTRLKEKLGIADARQFAAEALAVLLVVLLPLTIILMLAMPWLMQLVAPGFVGDEQKFSLAVIFGQIAFPYLLLISITALQGAVLNAHGLFTPAAVAPIIYNIFMIAAIGLAIMLGWDYGYVLAWSVTLAGIAQLLWLYVSCHRHGLAVPLRWPRFSPAIKQFFMQLGPGALGAGAAQINLLVTTILASLQPSGAVAHLFYADRLYQLPLGVVGIAVATALLPVLSKHIASNEADKTKHFFSRAIEFSLALGIPAMLGLALAAEPIIQTLFERGAFTPADTRATAAALSCYAIGVPAFLMVKIFSTVFFARQQMQVPVRMAMAAIAVNIVLCLTLPKVMGHEGIALAAGLSTWVNALLLFDGLRRAGWAEGDAMLDYRIPRLLLSGLVMAGVIIGLNMVLHDFFTAREALSEIIGLVLLLALALAAFLGITQLTGAMRWQDLPRMLQRPAQKNMIESKETPHE